MHTGCKIVKSIAQLRVGLAMIEMVGSCVACEEAIREMGYYGNTLKLFHLKSIQPLLDGRLYLNLGGLP